MRLVRGGAGGEAGRVVPGTVRDRDAEHRVDAGHDVADVAHVGREATERGLALRSDGPTKGAQVLGVAFAHHVIREHIGVFAASPGQFHRASGSLGGGFEAGDDARLEGVQFGHGCGADVPLGHGVVGDDVRLQATFEDDPVDAVAGVHLLAQHRDVVVGGDHCIEGVYSLPGRPGGVRVLPEVFEFERLDRVRCEPNRVVRRRVEHERRIDAFECASLAHEDFAAAAFFGGAAEQHDRALALAEGSPERECRCDSGDRDEIVPAGVANARQGVVLREEREGRSAASAGRFERGREFVGAAFDLETLGFEIVAEEIVCAVFLEVQFGVRMDFKTQFAQLCVSRLNRRGGSRLHCRERFAGTAV